jgi:hypothetical protein
MNPIDHQPTREECGLPPFTLIPKDQMDAARAQMQKQIEAWELDLEELSEGPRIALKNRIVDTLSEMKLYQDQIYVAAGRKLGFDENFLQHLEKERLYRSRLAEWKQYNDWLRTRNPARAELEKRHGYDVKHGYHLVRLLRMAREILEGKGVIVKRPDAEELRAIRFHGAWSFDQLIDWAKKQDEELEEVMKTSALPKRTDVNFLDEFLINVIDRRLTR